MKILHVIPTYLPASLASGPIEPIHALNKELVRQGMEVTVYATNGSGETTIDGVKVFHSPRLRKALRENIKNFDLVHISFLFFYSGSLAAHYARKFHIPYVITPHGGLMKYPLAHKWLKKKIYLTLIERNNIKSAALIHFTSDLERQESIESHLPLGRSTVIPLCVPSPRSEDNTQGNFFRKKFNIPENAKVILFLGRLNWIKGLDTLLGAFEEVQKEDKNTILVLAGPAERETKSTENVLYTGMLEESGKAAALRESNVFALTSYSENFSVVAVEAMNAGLPVVLTEGVGISPLVARAGAGFSVLKNSKAVSEALIKILKEPELAKKMGERGKMLAESEFAPEKVASRMLENYLAILGKIS